MTDSAATVELTKPAVAARLLKSAIRSYLRRDDPLGTYLLASASARLLVDLRRKRGDDWEEASIRDGIWYWARDYDPQSYDGPHEIVPLLVEIKERIDDGSLTGPQDLNVSGLAPRQRAELHRTLNRPYNFLKHADRDFLESLGEEAFDPANPLAIACISFQALFPNVLHEEADIYRYLVQRNGGRGYSSDLKPYERAFGEVAEVELKGVLLRFLDFDAEQEGFE